MRFLFWKKKKVESVATVESIYDHIKESLISGELSADDVQAIAELTVELAARTREADGK
jgi:hypothetical protein